MNRHDYTTGVTLRASPAAVFNAITHVADWWPGEFAGATDVLGESFTYRYRDLHTSTQRVSECVPGRRLAWTVLESRLSFVKDTSEWDGTQIIFDLLAEGPCTQLRFTHAGLRPPLECYAACASSWATLIHESLKGLVERGQGLKRWDFS